MTTIVIPQKLKENDLIAIPRKEYKDLIKLKKKMTSIFKPIKAELRILERSRKDFKNGNFIEWAKLRDELDNRNRRSSRKTA